MPRNNLNRSQKMFRKEIEKNLGVSMPDENAPLPDDVELELSRLSSEAAQKLLRKDQAEMQQKENMKQQEITRNELQADAYFRIACQ